jgi:hypothetical protein
MATFVKTVLVGQQAGKLILTGSLRAQEYAELLRGNEITVNPNAQRSLVPGVFKESTRDLIENDGVLKMPRMKNFLKFVHRVMDEGFFGSVSLVLPEKFTRARLETLQIPNLPDESRLAVLRANPMMGEGIFHIADGQGRIVGFYSLERELVLKIVKQKDTIKKLERKGLPAVEERKELAQAEKALERVRKFLSETDLSFVCYAYQVQADNAVLGLSEDAEKRCYIEGNALNSMASKEDVIKYEQFSPIIVDLQAFRDEYDWMSSAFIEEDSKSISSSSQKLFTLSALVQAYSWGVVNDNKPLKNIDMGLQTLVEQRKGFCHAFWSRISEIFEPTWLQDVDGEAGERAVYLKETRQIDRNVTFQATFLQGLGRLCYAMGKEANWDPNSPLLMKLAQLSPDLIDYRAVKKYHVDIEGTIHVDEWAEEWTRTMMKPSIDKKTGKLQGYAFNNASENVNAVRHLLAGKIGLSDENIGDEPDTDISEAA